MAILAQMASNDVLDSVYDWLCRRRRDYCANADASAFRPADNVSTFADAR
jgi:hypothetical protein